MTKKRPWFFANDPSESDNKVFVYFVDKDGVSRRLVKPKTKEIFSAVADIDVYRDSGNFEIDEPLIQVRFENAASSYRLNCKSFNYNKSVISIEFENCVSDPQKFVECFKSFCQNKNVSIIANSNEYPELNISHVESAMDTTWGASANSSVIHVDLAEPDANTVAKPLMTNSILSEDELRCEIQSAFLGFYVIDVSKLTVGEQTFREVDTLRVNNLAQEFLYKHNAFYQPICAMLKNCLMSKFSLLFGDKEAKIKNHELIVLGGQHSVAACKQVLDLTRDKAEIAKMLTPSTLDLIRTRYCLIYTTLSENAQVYLSKEHQRMQQNTIDLNFQDQIRLARQLRGFPCASVNDNWESLCFQYLKRDGKKEGSEELQTVMKLASLPDDVFDELLIVFSSFEKYKLVGQKSERLLKAKPKVPWTYFRGISILQPDTIKGVLFELRSKSISLKDLQAKWKYVKRMQNVKKHITSSLKCSWSVVEQKFGSSVDETTLEQIFFSGYQGGDGKELQNAVEKYVAKLTQYTVPDQDNEDNILNPDTEFSRNNGSIKCKLVSPSHLATVKSKSWFSGADLIIQDFRACNDPTALISLIEDFLVTVADLNASALKANYLMLLFVNDETASQALTFMKRHTLESSLVFIPGEIRAIRPRTILPYASNVTTIGVVSIFGEGGQKVVPKSNIVSGKSLMDVYNQLIIDLSHEGQTILSFIGNDSMFNRCAFLSNRNIVIVLDEKSLPDVSNAIFDICLMDAEISATAAGASQFANKNTSAFDFQE